jgi:hypothetical protein
VFRILRGDLRQLAAPFLVQFGDRQHDDGAVELRVDAEPAFADRLLDLADKRLVPDVHGDHARLGHVDGTDLINRRHGEP